MRAARAAIILAGFAALTLPLMPVQALLLKICTRCARVFPHWYHKHVCRLIGVRLHVDGEVARDRPVLLVANHTSWLDIPVLSALAPLSFIAKREVGSWPFVASLARLQRSVFVDRTRRAAAGAAVEEIGRRLTAGDTIVLFAEGTSSDGNRVLPFMSSLFAAVRPPGGGQVGAVACVQTLAVVYSRVHGVPLGRADRPLVGWYGDMEFGRHAWALLSAGPLDVEIRIGSPVPLESFADRKILAQHSEREVREAVVRLLRARPPAEDLAVVQPAAAPAPRAAGQVRPPSRKWT